MTTAEKIKALSLDTTLTIAEKIAKILPDGQMFQTDDGISLEALCEEYDASIEYGHTEWDESGEERTTRQISRGEHISDDPIRYAFPDDSAIVAAGCAWDIEGAEPFSWRE